MPLRDLGLVLLFFGVLPFVFSRPYVGVLLWSWVSYMNPHRLTWGFAYSFPFAQIVAIVTMLALVFSGQKLRVPRSPFLPVWAIFMLWMCASTVFAIYPDPAEVQLIKVLKIQLVTLLTMVLINSREKVGQLVWVIALSIGFFGVKGGVFTLLHGGEFRVWGPPGSFFQDNNELALSLLIVSPLFVFLHNQTRNVWVKWGLRLCLLLMAFSVIGSRSRGCMLAGAAVIAFLWWHSQRKVQGFIVLAALVGVLLAFAPEIWFERMQTIRTFQEDGSAMGRINAWWYAFNVANDRLFGAGFVSYKAGSFAMYAPVPDDVHAAHSIFFGVLADHGWPGLVMFGLLLYMSWRNSRWIMRAAAQSPDLEWAHALARMIQVSLLCYMVGGNFYSLAYFDLPWHLMAILVIVRDLIEHPEKTVTEPRPIRARGSRAAVNGRGMT